jgi:hypothetical protein
VPGRAVARRTPVRGMSRGCAGARVLGWSRGGGRVGRRCSSCAGEEHLLPPRALVSCGPGRCVRVWFRRRGSSGRRSSFGCVGRTVRVHSTGGYSCSCSWVGARVRFRPSSGQKVLVACEGGASSAHSRPVSDVRDVPTCWTVRQVPTCRTVRAASGLESRLALTPNPGQERRVKSRGGSDGAGRPDVRSRGSARVALVDSRVRRRGSVRLRRPGRVRGRVRSPPR